MDDIDDLSGMEIFDDEIQDKKIILTGEYHGVSENNIIQFKMIKYLKENHNLKYILVESSYSTVYLLNKYINTGENEFLEQNYINKNKNSISNFKNEFSLYVKLYEYNKTLADEDKLRLIGIDIEKNPNLSNETLKLILPKTEPPKELKEDINNIYNNKISDNLEKIYENYIKYEELYKEYLKENFFDFDMIINSLINTKELLSFYKDRYVANRDKILYDNFIKIHKELNGNLYFGQFGEFHIDMLNISGGEDTFATRLNKDKNFKDKILPICYFYYNSKSLAVDPITYNINLRTINSGEMGGKHLIYYDIRDINSIINEKVVVYKTKGKNSPFNDIKINSSTDYKNTDLMSYIIMISNGEAYDENIN